MDGDQRRLAGGESLFDIQPVEVKLGCSQLLQKELDTIPFTTAARTKCWPCTGEPVADKLAGAGPSEALAADCSLKTGTETVAEAVRPVIESPG